MTVTVTSFKGGAGKTTTAVHLAAYLERRGSTLLVDGDQNRSATRWAARGRLPFAVADADRAGRIASNHAHIVIETQARPPPRGSPRAGGRLRLAGYPHHTPTPWRSTR